MVAVKLPVPDRWLSKTSRYLGKALLVTALQVFTAGAAGKGEVEGSYQAGCMLNKMEMVGLLLIKISFSPNSKRQLLWH